MLLFRQCSLFYFLRFGLNFFPAQALHFTCWFATFLEGDLFTALHLLHTNLFLNILASASGNFTILFSTAFDLFHYFFAHYGPV